MGEFREEPGWREHVDVFKHDLLEKAAAAILGDMRLGAPVDTGALVESLDSEVVGDTARIGSKDVDYAAAVEDGHRIVYRDRETGELVDTGERVPPQPYMAPALYQERDLS